MELLLLVVLVVLLVVVVPVVVVLLLLLVVHWCCEYGCALMKQQEPGLRSSGHACGVCAGG